MVAFLKDPSGPPLWEENPEAKDVVHIETEKDFRKLLKKEERPVLMMFYAPWCGVCKRMQPIFQQTATETKGKYVLAGMNVHPAEFDGLKQEYNVKGYPTFCYFEKGKFLHHYENYGATPKDIADWLKNFSWNLCKHDALLPLPPPFPEDICGPAQNCVAG
ncbi:Protein disulfide-isomerase A5 [Ataeniobius toweri]|uniref:Protein disulfide-isomerase A5 n=1 Tax=Ataeniobius toweri TaxID=208326 RepID=A0ABU7CG22_9TELE|nr:Protein disulfide-isomerase A5 [Ataeniobius toweri]